MNDKVKEKVDEWFGGDYNILHLWEDFGEFYIVVLLHGSLYFMRVVKVGKKYEISQDAKKVLYHHDDYKLVGDQKYVALSKGLEHDTQES